MAHATPHKKAARRRQRRLQFALLGFLLAAGVSAWQWGIPYVLELPCWKVKEVAWESCPSELWETLKDPAASLIDRPLYEIWWHRAQIKEALQAAPPVRTVQLHLAWPNHLALAVTARHPLVVVQSSKRQRFYPVDEEGVLVAEETTPRLPLPVIYGLDLGAAQVGQALPQKTLRPLLDCVIAAQERQVDLIRLALGPDGTVRLRTSWEEVVLLGPAREIGRKLDLFMVAREDLRQHDWEFEYIDVSAPDTPVWKPRVPPGVCQEEPS